MLTPPVLPSWPQCRYLVFIKAHCVDVRLRRYEAAGSKIRLNRNFISLLQTWFLLGYIKASSIKTMVPRERFLQQDRMIQTDIVWTLLWIQTVAPLEISPPYTHTLISLSIPFFCCLSPSLHTNWELIRLQQIRIDAFADSFYADVDLGREMKWEPVWERWHW